MAIKSSFLEIAVKIVAGILWLPIALIIFFIANFLEYSSGSIWIFYIKAISIALIIHIIIVGPYLIFFGKNKWKWIFIALIIGLSLLYLILIRISTLFPPIPIYENSKNIEYSNRRSSMGLVPNIIIMKFVVPNGEDIETRKKVATFYKKAFVKRGYELRGYEYAKDCVESLELDYALSAYKDVQGCTIVNSAGVSILRLNFNKNKVSIFQD